MENVPAIQPYTRHGAQCIYKANGAILISVDAFEKRFELQYSLSCPLLFDTFGL
jgi:hypothetical protein